MSNKLLAPFLAAMMIAPVPASADKGGSEGHGGNRYTIEFQAAAKLGKFLLDSLGADEFPSVDRDLLLANINSIKLASEPARLDGKAESRVRVRVWDPARGKWTWEARCAVNYPASREIVISEKCWDSDGMRDNLAMKVTVALHEYFSFMNLERDTSPLSSAIAGTIFRQVAFDRERIARAALRLRADFAAASTDFPLESLQMNKAQTGAGYRWSCLEVSALSELPYEGIVHSAYGFRKHLLMNRAVQDVARGVHGQVPYAMEEAGLVEKDPRGKDVVDAASAVIRLSADGDLLVETVDPKPGKGDSQAGLLPSISFSGRTASAYRRCSIFPFRIKQRFADLVTAFRGFYLFDSGKIAQALAVAKVSRAAEKCRAKNRKSDCIDAENEYLSAFERHAADVAASARTLQEAWQGLFTWRDSLRSPERRDRLSRALERLRSKQNELELAYLGKYPHFARFRDPDLRTVTLFACLEEKRRSGPQSRSEELDCFHRTFARVQADYDDRSDQVFGQLRQEAEAIVVEIEAEREY